MAPVRGIAADGHCESEPARAGKVSDMGGAHSPKATETSTTAPAASVLVEHDLDRWKAFLREEDRRCQEHHIGAALVTVGLVRAADAEQATVVLGGVLRPTDRVGVLCEDELSVLLAPLDDILHAQKAVQQLDAALRAGGVAAHLGWAMRAEGHGLFHAAARADAAMLTARGHGRLDLSKR